MFSISRSQLLHRLAVRVSLPSQRRLSWLTGLTFLALVSSYPLQATAKPTSGTWSTVNSTSPNFYDGTMLLMVDGSVMVQSTNDHQSWSKLTPDSTGSYVNGTWTSLRRMSIRRRNFTSIVLPTGEVFVLGGEFSGPSLTQNNTNTGEIYDPVKDQWRRIANFPEQTFGNSAAVPAPGYWYSEYIVAGSPTTTETYVYNVYYDYWFSGNPKLNNDFSVKETWLIQPDYSILSYDVTASSTAGTGTTQRIDSSFTWINAGTAPLLTSPTPPAKIGPGSVLPNGKTIQVGGKNQTAIYTPPANFSGPGTWASGPPMPLGMGADGAPGAMLPDGHFVFLANTVPSTGPTRMFDFHYADGSLTDITATLPPSLQFRMNSVAANSFRMLILPNGALLLSAGAGSTTIYEYKPSGVPLDSWRPVIYDIYRSTPTQLTLEGYNLTGISEGATYGSDARMSSNYPIVKLSQVGLVKYARSTNWTAGISRPNSYNYDSATVDIPAGLNPGTYYVNVIANGIQSYGTTIQIAPSRVAAYYKDGLLNINGDDQPNNVSLTYKQVKDSGVLKSASVTVTANDTFTLINGKQSVTFDVALDRIRVNAIMGAGDDTISFSSFYAKTILLNLGDGDDTANLLYNSVDNTLALDGGTGFDTVTRSGNSVNKTTTVNIP